MCAFLYFVKSLTDDEAQKKLYEIELSTKKPTGNPVNGRDDWVLWKKRVNNIRTERVLKGVSAGTKYNDKIEKFLEKKN